MFEDMKALIIDTCKSILCANFIWQDPFCYCELYTGEVNGVTIGLLCLYPLKWHCSLHTPGWGIVFDL